MKSRERRRRPAISMKVRRKKRGLFRKIRPRKLSSSKKLRKLGYVLSNDLKITNAESGETYAFVGKEKYEEMATVVAQMIQELMKSRYNMKKVNLPLAQLCEGKGVDVQAPVYITQDASRAQTLLILLCGSGRVSAGQWSRQLCVNDSFHSGSVLPFLDWARTRSRMAVLVLNPNFYAQNCKKGMDPNDHIRHAWDAIIAKLPNIRDIVMVSHSYGGIQTLCLLKYGGKALLQKLRGVAFTDAIVPPEMIRKLPRNAQDLVFYKCVNWVTSEQPLDTLVKRPFAGVGLAAALELTGREEVRCLELSAGTNVHEETTMAAFASICKFIDSVTNQDAQT